MLTFAASATNTTIVYILIWGILFPAFVTGLIAYAVVVGRGEGQENEEHRRFSRRYRPTTVMPSAGRSMAASAAPASSSAIRRPISRAGSTAPEATSASSAG